MTAPPFSAKLLIGTLLALTAPCLLAQDGLEGALLRGSLATPFGPTLAIADFDDDDRPDGAVLVDSGRNYGQSSFRIELHFTGRANSAITFGSTESSHAVSARDIDHDNDIDVIVHQPFTQQRLHVWLNDGDGDFHEGTIGNYSSDADPAYERLKPPAAQQLHSPALSLPSQKGSEIATVARHLPANLFTGSEVEALSIACSPAPPAVDQSSPRSPPIA